MYLADLEFIHPLRPRWLMFSIEDVPGQSRREGKERWKAMDSANEVIGQSTEA